MCFSVLNKSLKKFISGEYYILDNIAERLMY